MELKIEQVLQHGVAAHKKGKLQEAERLYRAILQTQPAHPDANHNLGVLAVSMDNARAALPLFKAAIEANPKIEQFWLSYINALIKEKHFNKAKQVLEQAKAQAVGGDKLDQLEAQLASKNRTENVNSASPSQQQLSSLLTLYQTGKFSDAEKLAVSIINEFPKHQFGWKVLGAVLNQTGRVNDSLTAMRNSVKLSPQDAEAHNNLGVVLKELGRLEDALASYNQAITLRVDYAEAHNNVGNTLKELGRQEDALASYRQAITLKADYAEARNNSGNTLRELGKLDDAEASYKQAIELKPDYAEAYYNLGVTLKEIGRLDEAAASYSQAVALSPDHAEAHNNLGVMLKEVGRLDEALASYSQAIALKPDFAEAHNNLGITLKELGRLDEALASYTEAIALKPDFAEAHNNLGITLKEVGRLDEAEASSKQAIELKPDYAEAHNNLGTTLTGLGRLDKAEASHKQAIASKPNYAEAHNNLGITLTELGRLDEAEASYKQAIASKPDFALAYHNLGKILYKVGYKDLALETMKKANDIDPHLKEVRLMLNVIESRKSREENETAIDNMSNTSAKTGLTLIPLILHRVVEEELITKLYEMSSRGLDQTIDARYGNGKCSLDFNLFDDGQSIIKTLANDLTKIMMEAVKSDVHVYDSFFNILRAGGGSTPHMHLNDLDKDIEFDLGKQKYSLVYYLSVGDQHCSEPGVLKLYEPRENILPCDGMITIIPANRMHSAVYNGTKDRVMIGVNFYSL